MRSESDVARVIDTHADTIKRICMVYLKNTAETEDIFQTVFFKYATSTIEFDNDDHLKAWLIKITVNQCKDILKSFFRSKRVNLDDGIEPGSDDPPDYGFLYDALKKLPSNYRMVLYLEYYEGYNANEIGSIMHKNVNTIYTWIKRAKDQLKTILKEEGYEANV